MFAESFAGTARACETATVRDAAYTEPRNVHLLCVIGKTGDSAVHDVRHRLATWLKSSGVGLNLELTTISADDPNVRWSDYGLPSAPPSSPVVVLAGRRTLERKTFFIDHWEPAPSVAELEELKASPIRDAIRQEVGRRLALLLHVRGTEDGPGEAEKAIEATAAAWSKKEPTGVGVVRVDRTDRRERLLLSFMGVRERGPDWVAVVFGRGKLTPPLQGSEITEDRLNELLAPLVGECTCLRSPASMGVDLLMPWDAEADKSVVKVRTGDEPDKGTATRRQDPTVAASATGYGVLRSSVWTMLALFVTVCVVAAVVFRRQSNRQR